MKLIKEGAEPPIWFAKDGPHLACNCKAVFEITGSDVEKLEGKRVTTKCPHCGSSGTWDFRTDEEKAKDRHEDTVRLIVFFGIVILLFVGLATCK